MARLNDYTAPPESIEARKWKKETYTYAMANAVIFASQATICATE